MSKGFEWNIAVILLLDLVIQVETGRYLRRINFIQRPTGSS